MRAYQAFNLSDVAMATAHACGAISLAGPPVAMSVVDYFDAGGPHRYLSLMLENDRIALIEYAE